MKHIPIFFGSGSEKVKIGVTLIYLRNLKCCKIGKFDEEKILMNMTNNFICKSFFNLSLSKNNLFRYLIDFDLFGVSRSQTDNFGVK